MKDVVNYLASLKQSTPKSLHNYLSQFETFYNQKLWHQLTVSVEEFIKHPESVPYLSGIYENMINECGNKLNPLSLVHIASTVAKTKKPAEAIQFLSVVTETVKEHTGALVLATMETAHYRFAMNDLDGTLKAIEDSSLKLETLSLVDPMIHASYYRVCTDYDRIKLNYSSYYKNALLYLACTPLETMSGEEQLQRACDLGLAALLADSIYNFGELILHPIIEIFNGTQYEWMKNALLAFNQGNLKSFATLLPVLKSHPLLAQQEGFLRQKITLMALLELVFTNKNSLSFSVLAQETLLPVDEVEHLIMKALSLGLIKGHIDQVQGLVHVEWVQPRVLSKAQIGQLKSGLAMWKKKVTCGTELMIKEGGELLV